jgi:hypothetical protein
MHAVITGTISVVMRRLAGIVALAAATTMLAACGGNERAGVVGGYTTPGVHIPAKSSSSAPAHAPLTRAQAIAFAHAVNLTSADLPGFTATSKHERTTVAGKRLEHEVLRCMGGVPRGRSELAEVSSMDFKLKRSPIDFGMSSEVSVSRAPSRPTRELTQIAGNRARACLSHYLNLLLREQLLEGLRHQPIARAISTSISISHGTPPAPGATGSFGWRIVATVTVHKLKLPFYFDILGFVYGPAEVSLESSGSLRPFPAKIQEHLYMVLLERAETHVI